MKVRNQSTSSKTPLAGSQPTLPAKDTASPKGQLRTDADRVTTDKVRQDGALPQTASFDPLLQLPQVPLTPADQNRVPEPDGVLQGWWRSVVDTFTGSTASRETNRAKKVVAEVNKLEPAMQALTDAELKARTGVFKKQIADATTSERKELAEAEKKLAAAPLEQRDPLRAEVRKLERALFKAEAKILEAILPEAFATVREAARRATGMKHYDVQVMAGALMHHGMIAEMYTGEGKTLAATMPAYLNALAGHGYHVVTVNDYLARRDAEEMGEIYTYLGLDVGVLQNNHQQVVLSVGEKGGVAAKETTRQEAYKADITYGTASEFAFDYLRDNGTRDDSERVQRPLYGILLDEIDSLLIDEARIPHIIAGNGPKPDVEQITKFRDVVKKLDWKTDIEWDLEEHWVSLTESGLKKVDELLGIDDLYSPKHQDGVFFLNNALRAQFLLRRDEHYTVIDGEIRTVGHSGHALMGRRFTAGLHQALEALWPNEIPEIRAENQTTASITMRDYLSQYQKCGGMTGTAMSAKDLFRQIYGLDVARVPTRLKLIRVDHPDRIYATHAEKVAAFVADVEKVHKTGRPILIGTEFTNTAEELGKLLAERGLPVQVLGAKSDKAEAEIIANAGRKGSITVATTRGGRGVDIKLGGNAKVLAQSYLASGKLSPETARAEAAKVVAKERAEVLAQGGLLVMSFEHLDSRRRDDQLRGRAGRQGDPGATIFYTSMADPLFDGVTEVDGIRKGEKKFDAAHAAKLVERALDRSENKVNDVLTQSLPYDRVMNEHRARFYDLRRDIIGVEDCRTVVLDVIEQTFDEIFDRFGKPHHTPESAAEAKTLYEALGRVLPLPPGDPPPAWTDRTFGEIRADIDKLVAALLAKREKAVGEELARVLERDTLLRSMDALWCDYLEDSQSLREGIGWRAVAQKDPKLEFVKESAELYDSMIKAIRLRTTEQLLTRMPVLPPAPKTVGQALGALADKAGTAADGKATLDLKSPAPHKALADAGKTKKPAST